jgi:hypothetical protein
MPRELPGDLARLVASPAGERAQLVGLTFLRVRVADEEDEHRGENTRLTV